MKRIVKNIFVIALAVLVIGMLIPEKYQMPAGSTDSYNHQSFWWHPWTRGVNGSPHSGVDIFGKEGIDVHPAVGGIVLYCRWRGNISGNMVIILGPKWKIHEYMHLKEIKVHWLQLVSHDTVIGALGRTGNAARTPAHVHYSIVTCVPYPWLFNKEYGKGGQPEQFNWMKMFWLNPDEYLRRESK